MDELKIKFIGIDELRNEMKELKELVLFFQENSLPKYIPLETIEQKFLVTSQTLNKLAKKGKLKKYRLSDRKIYYATQDIYHLIESNQVKEFEPNKLNPNE